MATSTLFLGPVLPRFSALHHPARAVRYALLGAHAHRVLIGACNPMCVSVLVFRASRELRAEEQLQKAEANRIAVAEEKEKMRQLEIARLAEIERKKLEQKERNAESNEKRAAALAAAQAEKTELIRRETMMDIATQNAIKQANADAYIAEQKLLWEKAMKEAERDEIIKKREIKQAAKQAKIDEFERQKVR